MKVSTKLGAGFALHIVLLGALLVYHVRTIRETVSIGYQLTEMASRTYSTATAQVGRVAQLEENAAKHRVTRDAGYLTKFNELFDEYAAELAALRAQPLSETELAQLDALDVHWHRFARDARSLAGLSASRDARSLAGLSTAPDSAESLTRMQQSLDSVHVHTQRLSEASREAMLVHLRRSSAAARRAERLSWAAAAGALILSVLISGLIVRSISEPLSRLAHGTREVARGRFGYRLDTDREDEFADVARDFNTMTARLDELDRMKQDFISRVSHDLKTPLASMQETIDVLLDEVAGPLGPRQKKLLELNHESGRRLYAMIGKLLDLSRLEARVVDHHFGTADLTRIIAAAVEPHTRCGVPVATALPERPVVIDCDSDRILQLVDNLIENALKFARHDVTVTMRVLDSRPAGIPSARWLPVGAPAQHQEAGSVAHVIVSDDGPGVPDADRDRIFDRFVQGEAGRSVTGRGVGLGLTICREIADIHGGTIWVADRDGGGSEFHVLLPHAVEMRAPAPRPVASGTHHYMSA